MNADKPGLLTTGEAARELSVSRDTIIRWCRDGILDSDRDGHVRRISASEVMRFYAAKHVNRTKGATTR